MKEQLIKIHPFGLAVIKSIHIERKVGHHSEAVIEGIIANSDYEEYKNILKKNEVWVQIKVFEDYDMEEKIIFWGIITASEITHKGDEKKLTLKLSDGTILMDTKKHIRVFQNKEETYRDVFDVLNQTYSKCGIISTVESRKRLGRLYVQYEETDWEFLCRMASELHTFVVPDIYTGGVKYYLGLPVRGENQLSGIESHRIRQGERDCHIVKSREIYEIGEVFSMDGVTMSIYEISSDYINGEFIHEYILYAPHHYHTEPYLNERISGCSLIGVVEDVKMDIVKLRINDDERSGQSLTWFPYATIYSSPDGAGWYCMPEIGDTVRLHFPNANESHGYVINAVHRETDMGRNNPDHKSFKTRYGKEILMTPEKIEITNNNGTRIMLSDEYGIILETDKSINMNASGNILITTKQGNLTLKSTEMIKLQQNETVMKLDEDIILSGGELRIQ